MVDTVKTRITSRFDSADYLDSAEAIAAYLDAYFEDGTPEALRNALDTIARSKGMSGARPNSVPRKVFQSMFLGVMSWLRP